MTSIDVAAEPLSAPAGTSPALTLRRGAGWLTISVVLVGILNYTYSVALAWLLPASAYAMFGGGQALLLACGTIANASVPWLVSQGIARTPDDADERRRIVSFAALLAVVQGLVAASTTLLVSRTFASGAAQLALAGSALAIFCAAVGVGYLQGFARFPLIAGLRVGEVLVKLALGLTLAVVATGAAGPLAGFGVGALAVVVVGSLAMRGDLRIPKTLTGEGQLWRRAAWLAGIQTAMAVLANIDVLLVSALLDADASVAEYQIAITLGRIPVFLSLAFATAAFPALSVRRAAPGPLLRMSVDLYLRTAVPVAIVLASVPQSVLGRVFPAHYDGVGWLLPFTATSGVLIGAGYVVASGFQARQRYRSAAGALAIGLALHVTATVAGLQLSGVRGAAIGAAVGAGCTITLLALQTQRIWPGSLGLRASTVAAITLAAPLLLLESRQWLWLTGATLVLTGSAWALWQPGRSVTGAEAPSGTDDPPVADRRLRILHLAFEDHQRPGSGGGAVRTREVNRRLALRHDITVVTARYPAARDRLEDGVRYVHTGLSAGYFGSIVSYFLSLPLVLRRYPSDLVVEDFAAPVSSVLVPGWTRRPVVGMVQWLNAREKSRQYKLPFFLMERWGVRSHRRLIAVSSDLAAQLRALNPSARVEVIPEGLDLREAMAREAKTRDVVYLGRLEMEQKGLDLLLQAFARVAPATTARLTVAGDGRDAAEVRRLCGRLGLAERVEFVGRVDGREKARLLASAQIVCMPSRFETFGIVAAEALAAGTPVLAFDIPCLREVLPASCGVRVPAFDVEAYAAALLKLLCAPERCRKMGEAGRRAVAGLDWDEIAVRQEGVYLDAVDGRTMTARSQQPGRGARR